MAQNEALNDVEVSMFRTDRADEWSGGLGTVFGPVLGAFVIVAPCTISGRVRSMRGGVQVIQAASSSPACCVPRGVIGEPRISKRALAWFDVFS